MRYQWADYHRSYEETVESWLDQEAVKYTGCDDGWSGYFEYWVHEPGTALNENFFAKVILDHEEAIGIMAIFAEESRYYIQEFIISPDNRRKGIGSEVLKELLENGECIVGKEIKSAEACIFPSNVSSRRAFEKAGFQYSHSHPDGNACYYVYQKEIVE